MWLQGTGKEDDRRECVPNLHLPEVSQDRTVRGEMKKHVWRSEQVSAGNENVYRCWLTRYTKDGGYVEDEAKFSFDVQKMILCIDGGNDQLVYLSPEQVTYLAELFRVEEKEFVEACKVHPKDDSDVE